MTTDIRQLVLEVLKKGYVMSLGTVDENGVWVANVTHLFDEDLNVYWMSSLKTRHSEALLRNPKVAATITVSSQGEYNLGIQLEGIAQKIEGPRYDLAVKQAQKKGKPAPAENEDVLQGKSWYMLKPAKIELIHQELFGFKKQTLKIN